jgi:NLR family CARD domain-containing protein 3
LQAAVGGKPSEVEQLEFVKALSLLGAPAIKDFLRSSTMLDELSAELAESMGKLARGGASTVKELQGKYVEDAAFTYSYGGLDSWFAGLDGLVGPPHPNLLGSMEGEHVASADSRKEFHVSNYGTTTTSEIEWAFVYDPEGGLVRLGLNDYPQEEKLRGDPSTRSRCRVPKPPAAFDGPRRELKRRLQQCGCKPLLDVEFLGARLYT